MLIFAVQEPSAKVLPAPGVLVAYPHPVVPGAALILQVCVGAGW
jgi:hypothetical protein